MRATTVPVLDRVQLAAQLRELAGYLRLEREPYRARAHETAAQRVETVPGLEELISRGQLTRVPGLGPALSKLITTLAHEGSSPLLQELRGKWPKGAERRRDRGGFTEPGLTLPIARALADELVTHLRASPRCLSVALAGDARRASELVRDLVLVVSTHRPDEVVAHLRAHPLVGVIEQGPSSATVALVTGEALTVELAAPERFGSTLLRASAAPGHWAALEARARQLGVDSLDAATEVSVYAALALPYLPPEIRDGTDELEAALAGELDGALLDVRDVRGAIHCHTDHSDGKATIEEMALAAMAMGLDYLTVTDHSAAAHYAGGLDLDGLRRQWDEIDAVQERVRIRIFRGTEVDILADGALDWPDAVLERLDVVIASVHQRHRLDEDQATRRLVRAMQAPVFKIWGHPLGRLLGRRPPIACRIDEVLDAIAGARAAIELNGDPHRLDLAPDLARRAHARGIKFVVSSDAHSTGGLANVTFAVEMARRARLRASDVLNTLPAPAFLDAVRPGRRG